MSSSPSLTAQPDSKGIQLQDIEASLKIVEEKREPDEKDLQETRGLDARKMRAEIDAIEQGNSDRAANRQLRSQYADKVYKYLSWYTFGALVITLLAGFKIQGFALPDLVLSTIVGSTAVAAIGLVGFVVNGLFKPNS